jgi:cytochrome c2
MITKFKCKTINFIYTFLVISFFIVGAYVGSNGWLSYEQIKESIPPNFINTVKNLQRQLKIFAKGEDAYTQVKLNSQYTQVNLLEKSTKIIQSSLLPLRIDFTPLAWNGHYPTTAGAITVINGKVVIFDRLGNIYIYDKEKLVKIKTPLLPNNVDMFIRKSTIPLDSDSLRTHSIAYDKIGRKIFVSYEKYNFKSNSYKYSLSAIAFDDVEFQTQGEWLTIFEGADRLGLNGQAGGGKLLVAGNMLYFSVGDYEPDSTGKIYSYNLKSKEIKLKSHGHRNTQGLAMTENQELINVEHGPQGGDEVNRIVDGGNYGFPYVTYGTDYGSYKWKLSKDINNLHPIEPLFSWVPSIGASSITQITSFHKSWKSDLLVGSLKAQSLYRLKYKENRIIFCEPIWIGHRIRDILELGQSIYLLTDDGFLIKVTPDEVALSLDQKSKLAGIYQDSNLSKCMVCHHFGETNPTHSAPSLSGVIGKKIASDVNFNYSPALSSKKGIWTKESLTEYLRDPTAFAKGTAMPRLNLDDNEISKIIAKLSKSDITSQ